MIKCFNEKQLQSISCPLCVVIYTVRLSYQPGDRCCTLHTSWPYFTLDLGVQRTHRQSARRLTQPVDGSNLFLLVDTSIRALQGVMLPPV